MESLIVELERLPDYRTYGHVAGVQGLLVEVGGLFGTVSVGTRVNIEGSCRRVVCALPQPVPWRATDRSGAPGARAPRRRWVRPRR